MKVSPKQQYYSWENWGIQNTPKELNLQQTSKSILLEETLEPTTTCSSQTIASALVDKILSLNIFSSINMF